MHVLAMAFAVPAIAAVVVLVAILWGAGILQRRRYDRLVGSRFPIGPLGVIHGAEPIALAADGASMGVVLLHGFGDTPQTVASLARALRDRVRNYLGAFGSDSKTDALLNEVARLEVIVTDSVVEALALENNLIKQRAPKYNILLRDDKNYPYLQLTTNEPCPRVLVARRVERDGSFYAGPFLPATFARKTMALTHRLFGIRSCNEVIDGRRGNPDLERIAVPPGHRGDARVGLDMEGEGEPALRRIETVPTHCSCRLDCL